ncbi:MAG TPA: MDR family MFS transporter [Ilumatobacteraceae bacterium]|nr:MDR family MFS transporter [Ilumatobacteraceae bacterium]
MTYPSKVMTVYILGLFMTIIDGTMVNVALPTMAEDFGVAATEVEWIAVGYLLTYAAVIPAAGWLGDRFGTKTVFVTALIAFVVTSIACGLAQTLGQLIAFRILQGLGAGLVTPIGAAMLYRAFPMEERAKAAIGVLSVAVIAPAIGPLLGGILVDTVSWHWIFLINGPIGAVAIALSASWLTETKMDAPGRFDVAGFVLSGATVGLLLYTLSIGPERGWFSPYTVSFALAGTICLVALVVIELRIPAPILTLRLLGDRLFRTINISAAMTYAGFFGMIFVLPLYLQSLRGYTAFESGLAQSPQAVGVFLVSNLLGKRLYRLVGPRRLMVVGTAVTAAITCLYATADLTTPLSMIAGWSFMRGLAVGMVFVSIQTAAYATTSMADTGRATSLFNTQRQVSYAVGVALAATVIAAVLPDAGSAAPAAERLGAYQAGFLAVGLIMVPAVFVSWFVDDDDVAATRGLTPKTPAVARTGPA